jgi:hypothetical protein
MRSRKNTLFVQCHLYLLFAYIWNQHHALSERAPAMQEQLLASPASGGRACTRDRRFLSRGPAFMERLGTVEADALLPGKRRSWLGFFRFQGLLALQPA